MPESATRIEMTGGSTDGTTRADRCTHPPAGVTLEPIARETGAPRAASAVLTSSGTMSMHCALAGIPGAIAYRANPVTYVLGRMLVQVEYLGIANLLLKEPMYPEYIQGAAKAEVFARELRDCVENPTRQAQTAAHAAKLRALLNQPSNGSVVDWMARRLGF